VGVDEGQGCGYSNEGLLFHAGGSYRLTLIDLGGMSGWCQVPNPPATVLHVQVFDMANGQRMDDGKP
jgi:hypothetical protein